MDRIITKNNGLNKHKGAKPWRSLDSTRHVRVQSVVRPDGYVDAQPYNDQLNTSGMALYRAPGARVRPATKSSD
jgi:hypothetical protein